MERKHLVWQWTHTHTHRNYCLLCVTAPGKLPQSCWPRHHPGTGCRWWNHPFQLLSTWPFHCRRLGSQNQGVWQIAYHPSLAQRLIKEEQEIKSPEQSGVGSLPYIYFTKRTYSNGLPQTKRSSPECPAPPALRKLLWQYLELKTYIFVKVLPLQAVHYTVKMCRYLAVYLSTCVTVKALN